MTVDKLRQSFLNSDLDEQQIQLLIDHSECVIHVEELHDDPFRREQIQGRDALGVGNNQYLAAVSYFNLVHWNDIPISLSIDSINTMVNHGESRIDIFTQDIISTSGRPVAFFVPNQVLTHPNAGATSRELEWCLHHPESLRSTMFIFGLYDKKC